MKIFKIVFLIGVILVTVLSEVKAITIDEMINDPSIKKTTTKFLPDKLREKFNYSKKLTIYKKMSKQGNLRAKYKLAYYYYHGIATRRNREEASKLYTEVAKKSTGKLKGLASLRVAEIDFPKSLSEQQFKGEKFINLINYAIKHGAVDGYKLLADVYFEGRGVKRNIPKALDYLALGRENNSGAAYAKSAYLYSWKGRKYGFKKDPKKFKKYSKKACELGNSEGVWNEARGRLFPILKDKDDVRSLLINRDDVITAKPLLLKILTTDITKYDKINIVARLVLSKEAKEQLDMEQFMKELIEIDNNNYHAIYELASLYLYGRGIKGDLKKALEMLNYLENKGFIPATKCLAVFYKNEGYYGDAYVKSDYAKAMVKYYSLAQNYNECNGEIAKNYFNKARKNRYNEKIALRYATKALKYNQTSIELFDVISWFYLGEEYSPLAKGIAFDMDGHVIPTEKTKPTTGHYMNQMIRLLKKYTISYPCSYEASKCLAKLMLKAKRFKDYKLIVEIAHNNGDVYSSVDLIHCYLKGIGTEKNEKKAREIVVKLLDSNHPLLTRIIDIIIPMYATLNKKDLPYFKNIIEQRAQHDENFFNILISCYENGYGVEKDLQKVLELLTKKAENENNISAMHDLVQYYRGQTPYSLNGYREIMNKEKFFYWLNEIYKLEPNSEHIGYHYLELVKCYLTGHGTMQNIPKAKELMDQKAYKNFHDKDAKKLKKLLDTSLEKIKNIKNKIKELEAKLKKDDPMNLSFEKATLAILKFKLTEKKD